MKRLILILATFLVAFGELSAREVQFKDNGEALVNPGMGFCHYAYAGRLWAYGSKNPAWDTLDWFPGCSTVYMRLLWCDLEPEEGVYRWDILDRPIISWQIDGETLKTVVNFILGGSKITADGDCSHEIKRCFLLGRKAISNLDSILKSRDVNLPQKFVKSKLWFFPGHVWI